MPCLKQKMSPISGIKKSAETLDVMKIEFIGFELVAAADIKNIDSEALNSFQGSNQREVEENKVEEEEEEEEEETDMVTALQNARAKAVLKTIKDQAIADGTYVYVKKVKSIKLAGGRTGGGDLGSTLESVTGIKDITESYWRTVEGSLSSLKTFDLSRLHSDLLAETAINDGELKICSPISQVLGRDQYE